MDNISYSGKIGRALNWAKNGYELILTKFKFGDWALVKAMTSSLLYHIMREIKFGDFFNSPNWQINALNKFSCYTVYLFIRLC